MQSRHLLALLTLLLAGPVIAQVGCPWPPTPACEALQRDDEARRAREAAQAEQREREERDEEERRLAQQREEAQRREEPQRLEQQRQLAESDAALRLLRTRLLATAPLPPARNPLLGTWRVAANARPADTDGLSQLLGMSGNSGALCAVVFGEGTTEFLPGSWIATDSLGSDSLGSVQYRTADNRLYALPDQVIPLLAFEQIDATRIQEVRMPGCVLVRVDPAPATGGRPSASGRGDDVCRMTLLDQLGRARLEQGRQHVARRFTQTNDVTSPEAPGWIRIEARRSACDDARVMVTLHDFDGAGVLRSVTYLWRRQVGPAPSAMFSERQTALSRLHSVAAGPSARRFEAEVPTGRLVLEDIPEQNLVAETYTEKR